MKLKTLFNFSLFMGILASAQANYELSTMRIGPFNMKMDPDEADKIAGKKLTVKQNDGTNFVNYNGEIIEIYVWESSDSSYGTKRNIGHMKTSSKKFRTKGGMGVGSTRDELLDAFRNFRSFSISPEWNDDGSTSKTESFFVLTDLDAHTFIRFEMKNDVVTEVAVYYDEGGC